LVRKTNYFNGISKIIFRKYNNNLRPSEKSVVKKPKLSL